MRCPNCHVKNSEISNYCRFCGFDLSIRPESETSKKKWPMVFLFVCLLALIGTIYFNTSPFDDPLHSEFETPLLVSETDQDLPEKTSSQKQTPIQRPDFSLGMVTIYDIGGRTISKAPVPIVSGGWAALPKNICLGGYRWDYTNKLDHHVDIEWGILHEQDEAGLWWIEGFGEIHHPELSPWLPEDPLYWSPLLTHEAPTPVTMGKYSEQGNFLKFDLGGQYSKPGIFFQQDHIVGWSFGKEKEGGYLWSGIQGKDLSYDFRVEDFYRLTFAGSREEAFARALGEKSFTKSELLAALAEGFLLETILPEKDLPTYVQHHAIVKKMRALTTSLISDGDDHSVASTFDAKILIQIQDPLLLSHVVYAVMKNDGYENAIWIVESVRPHISLNKDSEKNRLNNLQKKLYEGWLLALMENERFYDAGLVLDKASEFFPEDPLLHLWRVQLTLEYDDWVEAQHLLYSRTYPISLQDKANNLRDEISDLKSKEGKIVIHFSPGSKTIPVYADLNENARQKFLIDTGASITTIPSAKAKELGIETDINDPIRTLSTAGGLIRAPEITLSSIQIDNWKIRDMKVLIVDIPHQEETGLLGLNFLNRFRMNLNSNDGILTLEPR